MHEEFGQVKERARRFRDRAEAGRALAERLAAHDWHDPVVLALPRGGVPVAAAVAARLDAPVDVFVARKVGLPEEPEVGIGAVAEGWDGMVVGELAERLGLDTRLLEQMAAREHEEIRRRIAAYRGDRALPELSGRDVILVDDGVATGVTTEAAVHALRARRPRGLLVAVPVCAPDSRLRLAGVADSVVCLSVPDHFRAVGAWYRDFTQVTDDEVRELLAAARAGLGQHQHQHTSPDTSANQTPNPDVDSGGDQA